MTGLKELPDCSTEEMLSGLDGSLSLVHNNYAPNTTNTAANFTVAEWKEMLGERLDKARKVWSGLDKSKSFDFEADFSPFLSVFLSFGLSVCLLIHLSICPSIFLSVNLFIFIH